MISAQVTKTAVVLCFVAVVASCGGADVASPTATASSTASSAQMDAIKPLVTVEMLSNDGRLKQTSVGTATTSLGGGGGLESREERLAELRRLRGAMSQAERTGRGRVDWAVLRKVVDAMAARSPEAHRRLVARLPVTRIRQSTPLAGSHERTITSFYVKGVLKARVTEVGPKREQAASTTVAGNIAFEEDPNQYFCYEDCGEEGEDPWGGADATQQDRDDVIAEAAVLDYELDQLTLDFEEESAAFDLWWSQNHELMSTETSLERESTDEDCTSAVYLDNPCGKQTAAVGVAIYVAVWEGAQTVVAAASPNPISKFMLFGKIGRTAAAIVAVQVAFEWARECYADNDDE